MPLKDQEAISWLYGSEVPSTIRARPQLGTAPGAAPFEDSGGLQASSGTQRISSRNHHAREYLPPESIIRSKHDDTASGPLSPKLYLGSSHNPTTAGQQHIQPPVSSFNHTNNSMSSTVDQALERYSPIGASTVPTASNAAPTSGSGAVRQDIRHAIAPENHMMVVNHSLFLRPYDSVEEDQLLASTRFKNSFIEDWRSNVLDGSVVNMTASNVAKFYERDIDTLTGKYLPPVPEPHCADDQATHQSYTEHERAQFDKATVDTAILKAKRNRAERKSRIPHTIPPPVYDLYPASLVVDSACQGGEEGPGMGKIEYVLRPARGYRDSEAIARIYNHGTVTNRRTWDTEVVDPYRFHEIILTCQRIEMPCIVAAGLGRIRGKVLGFGFMQPINDGFGPIKSGAYASRLIGKLTVCVCPNYRQKNIGSAIVDRILVFMSREHPTSVIRHAWASDQNNNPYNTNLDINSGRPEILKSIIVEALFRGDEDPDWEWFNRMLGRLGFRQVGRMEGAYSTRRGLIVESLDKYTWMHKARA